MAKKKSRHSDPQPLPPDDPIYTEGKVRRLRPRRKAV